MARTRLFNRRALDRAVATSRPPTSAEQAVAARWAGTASNQYFRLENEKPHQGDFLNEVFGQLLGYRAFTDADDNTYDRKAESASTETVGGQTPDGQLGFFNPWVPRTLAVIELKAPGADLDAKQQRADRRTPVEQGFGYVPKFDGCRWVIVSNFVTIRLYWTVRGEGYYWECDVAELDDPAKTAELIRVMHRDNLLGPSKDVEPPTAQLAEESRTDEVEITEAFYGFFKANRASLFDAIVTANPPADPAVQVAHESALLRHTQTILDRLLFICFAEDTGLLPRDVLNQALDATTAGFATTTRWMQLSHLFDAINVGNEARSVFGYNGGLFAHDPNVASLQIPDEALGFVYEMSTYDFSEQLGVEVLGRVFERSIIDIEALHAEIDPSLVPTAAAKSRSKRSQEGVFYTPDWVTRFLATETLGAWVEHRFDAMRETSGVDKIPARNTTQRRNAEVAFWESWQNELKTIKVLDPACGSGAFLVAAFDALYTEYDRANRELATWRGGQAGLFDPDKDILESNLYGVDINNESVEITRLSLWLKTAKRGRTLTTLANTIRHGNSLINPPSGDGASSFDALDEVESRSAFDWHDAFPEVFDGSRPNDRRGFDIVVGNPPYVRGEWLSSTLKDYFSKRFQTYGRRADLLVYFFERSIELMAPDARLGFIVSNKFLKAGYGEPLRRYLARNTRIDSLIDFGHAPIFQDADTFPVMTLLTTPAAAAAEGTDVRVAAVPREELGATGLSQLITEKGFSLHSSRFTEDPWSLESAEIQDLMAHLEHHQTLTDATEIKPLFGIKTGYNDAYIIDRTTRDRLVSRDPSTAEFIKPMIRGQNLHRWTTSAPTEYMIGLGSSDDRKWPWSNAENPEAVFQQTHPALHEWLVTDATPDEDRRTKLMKRSDQGRHWWELRRCAYYEHLDAPKLLYTDIAWQPEVAADTTGLYVNNSAYFLPGADPWSCAVLNSPVIWWYAWRTFQHGKDEALRWFTASVSQLPYAAQPSVDVAGPTARLAELALDRRERRQQTLAWLKSEHGIAAPGKELSDPDLLIGLDTFIDTVKKRSTGQTTSARLASLTTEHATLMADVSTSLATSLDLERQLAGTVEDAYGLTEEQKTLLRDTAPPRTPLYRG